MSLPSEKGCLVLHRSFGSLPSVVRYASLSRAGRVFQRLGSPRHSPGLFHVVHVCAPSVWLTTVSLNSRRAFGGNKREGQAVQSYSNIKRLLRNLGVDASNFSEKSKLVEAYAEAVIAAEFRTEIPAPATTPAPEPVDPFSDVPDLVSALDPPDNGCWVLVPSERNSAVMVDLLYWFFQDSQFQHHNCGTFSSDSILNTAVDGSAWIRSPPNESNGVVSYDITMVNQSGFVVDMYYNNIDSKAIAAFNNVEIDFRNRMWALVPREDTDSGETLLDLVYANNQYPSGKAIVKRNPADPNTCIIATLGGLWPFLSSASRSPFPMAPGMLAHVGLGPSW